MKFSTLAIFAIVGALPGSRASSCGEGSSRIFCQNGGICRSGRADFSMYQLKDGSYHDVHRSDNDQVYCECDPGVWTGIDCSIPVENCADETHFCLHGGSCVANGTTNSLYCDCSSAFDDEGNRYVGKWCEHKEVNHCEPDGNGFTFCLHDGVCNTEFSFHGPPCECKSHFDGPHCEYHVEDALPECTLDCQNGGICKLGLGVGIIDEHQYYEVDNDKGGVEEYMYCDCPPGKHGELCKVDSIPCGEDRCYNGGECVTREAKGGTIFHCNCNTAGDSDTRYAGKFCQYPSNEICTNPGWPDGQLFCVNGGQCQADPYRGCNCNAGFEGFACEFRVSTEDVDLYDDDGDDGDTPAMQLTVPGFDVAEEAFCELMCNGNGTCRKGIKNIESLGVAAYGNYLNETHTDNFEHCVCDVGFVGLQCEHQVQICGENVDEPDNFCLHGGTCIATPEDKYACDCSTASSDLGEIFTGKHCQHPGTSCVAESSDADPKESFCANGGACIDNLEGKNGHVGCDCAPGWTGDFCTVWTLIPSSVEETEDECTTKERNASRVVVLVLLLVSLGMVGVYAVVKYMNRCRYFKESSVGMDLKTARSDSPTQIENLAPHVDDGYMYSSSSRDPMVVMAGTSPDEESYTEIFTGPPQDDDGHELHNVKIV